MKTLDKTPSCYKYISIHTYPTEFSSRSFFLTYSFNFVLYSYINSQTAVTNWTQARDPLIIIFVHI